MKKRYFSISLFFCLFLSFILPCSAAVSDIDDTLVVDSFLYATDSSYTDTVWLAHHELIQGETSKEVSKTFAQVPDNEVRPNYFRQELQIKSSSGLPICDANNDYKFSLSGFYTFLNDQVNHPGLYYLSSIDRVQYQLKYTDGTWSSINRSNLDTFFEDNFYGVSIEIFSGNKDVETIYIGLYYDLSDFNYPGDFNQVQIEDWSSISFNAGVNDFTVTREHFLPILDGIGTLFVQSFSWLSDITRFIVLNPLLFIVVFCFSIIGFIIALTGRLKEK